MDSRYSHSEESDGIAGEEYAGPGTEPCHLPKKRAKYGSLQRYVLLSTEVSTPVLGGLSKLSFE